VKFVLSLIMESVHLRHVISWYVRVDNLTSASECHTSSSSSSFRFRNKLANVR